MDNSLQLTDFDVVALETASSLFVSMVTFSPRNSFGVATQLDCDVIFDFDVITHKLFIAVSTQL